MTRAEFCWMVCHWGGRGGTRLTQRTALALWQGMVHTSDPDLPGARVPGLGADDRRYTAHRIPCAPPAANGDVPACSLEAEVRVRILTARVSNNRLVPASLPSAPLPSPGSSCPAAACPTTSSSPVVAAAVLPLSPAGNSDQNQGHGATGVPSDLGRDASCGKKRQSRGSASDDSCADEDGTDCKRARKNG